MENTITQSADAKQYIVVKLGNEQFGIDIQYVDNIVRMQRITRVPKVQNYFKGVINLRGDIVPVMSLRLKFGLDAEEYTNATRVIILKPEGKEVIGVVVDEVKEVVTLEDEQIDKVTYTPSNENYKYLSGIGKYKDSLISILNIQSIVVDKEAI
ncbi:MAG: chemotaxis protein CheW [bacterium]|nr:chemotaxis protein CheW [bacterium]